MNKYLERIILIYKFATKNYLYPPLPKSIKLDVPYFSQWESKELVADILSGKIDARDDPKWKQSGAKDKNEYLNWSWSTCGMACLKMILASMDKKIHPIVELGKLCQKYGGYKINNEAYQKNDYKNSIDGLFYQPVTLFLEKEFNLTAKVVKFLSLEEILYEVSKHNFVIASVDPKIRIPSDKFDHKGGHLVLIVGYDLPSKTLLLHNPSGLPKKSQEYAKISFADFEKFFGHKGIVVYS